MDGAAKGVTFSVPYEMAVVRPLRQTTEPERQAALAKAHYNTDIIPQELIYIDLSTDSGVSASSTGQLAAAAKSVEPGMGLASEGSGAYGRLAAELQRYFGFDYFVPTTQGRSAERIWTKINVKPGSVVAGNLLFPSTRSHIEMTGAQIVDVIGEAAHDFATDDPFKGNIDLDKLEKLVQEKGAGQISCIYVELSVNSCGGHPVSLGNLSAVKALAARHKIPLFLDACRILENSSLIKVRERAVSAVDTRRYCPGNLRPGRRRHDECAQRFSSRNRWFYLYPRSGRASKRRRCRVFSTASSSRPAPWMPSPPLCRKSSPAKLT